MIGVIPAAGKGTRLGVPCKALYPYQNRFLIEYAIHRMMWEGIEEIVIIHHGDDIPEMLGSIYQMALSSPSSIMEKRVAKLYYIEQKERKGIAHAVSLVGPEFPHEDMMVIFADVLYFGYDLKKMKASFDSSNKSLFGVKYVTNQNLLRESYGYDAERIVEKPEEVDSLRPYLGLGIYMFKPNVYNFIKTTEPGLNDEIQITDTLNLMYRADEISPYELKGDYTNINYKKDLPKL
mgnify:FL=1|tara:strand:- start:611 stop:1315 length:705 start_codon:yes stop_codon:yes gene_type:complete